MWLFNNDKDDFSYNCFNVMIIMYDFEDSFIEI